jgi:hypothetical protein
VECIQDIGGKARKKKRPVGRRRRMLRDNTKLDIRYVGLVWTEMISLRIVIYEYCNETSSYIKFWEIVD